MPRGCRLVNAINTPAWWLNLNPYNYTDSPSDTFGFSSSVAVVKTSAGNSYNLTASDSFTFSGSVAAAFTRGRFGCKCL